MIDLMNVYKCPDCGDILEDQITYYEEIDCDHDDIYTVPYCNICGSFVARKYLEKDGERFPCMQKVDHERWLWANGFYDDF